MPYDEMLNFEERTAAFAGRCINVCEAIPAKRIGTQTFRDQLFRSATSVAANYAEAEEAESRADFVHKLKLALKELSEARVWLRIIGSSGYLDGKLLESLIGESIELSRMLGSSIVTARKNNTKTDLDVGNV